MPQFFKTVSEKLLPVAEETVRYFRGRGFTVSIEKLRVGYPYTPTLECKRQHTTIIVELFENVPDEKLDQWVAYARSSNRDIRMAVCVQEALVGLPHIENQLREKGIGLYVLTPGGIVERISPPDLGLTLYLPPLQSLPQKVRNLLGPAYDYYTRTQWRECFEEACKILEAQARSYLKNGLKTGRIVLLTHKGVRVLSQRQINRMTMGNLAKCFGQIQNQNHSDAVIEKVLTRINRDRVRITHHKASRATETHLRANVGQHMWVIVDALKQIV